MGGMRRKPTFVPRIGDGSVEPYCLLAIGIERPGMRRREFVSFLGGSVAAWPSAVRAQQKAMPVIGFLAAPRPARYAPFLAAFRQGLSETGYVEGQNLAIEYRWAEDHSIGCQPWPPISSAARSTSSRHVAARLAALAAKSATSTIPIVFIVGDPVAAGLVASLARPGGNLTGVALSRAS